MFRAVKHGNVHESNYELGILGSALLPSKILFIKRNIFLESITSLDWGHRRLLVIFTRAEHYQILMDLRKIETGRQQG